MKKTILTMVAFVLITVVAFPVFAGGSREQGPIVLRLAENQPPDNPVTIAMNIFADLVAEKTNGEVIVEVYDSAQLGQEPETIEQTQAGVIQLTRVNSVVLAEVAPQIEVFTLPFIFADQDHKYRVLDGPIGDAALESLKDHGLIGFAYMEAGTRNFYLRERAESLADLQGLQIRVQPAEMSIRMTGLLGAAATPMNYGEVYSGLQSGVIDGAENDYVSYFTSSHYEVAPYYLLSGHLSPPALLLMNLSTFEGLSAAHQQAISEAAVEASIQQRDLMNAFQFESRDRVVAAGVEIIEVNVEEFQQAVGGIYDEFPQHRNTIQQIRALQ